MVLFMLHVIAALLNAVGASVNRDKPLFLGHIIFCVLCSFFAGLSLQDCLLGTKVLEAKESIRQEAIDMGSGRWNGEVSPDGEATKKWQWLTEEGWANVPEEDE